MITKERLPHHFSRRQFMQLFGVSLLSTTQHSSFPDLIVYWTQLLDRLFKIRSPRTVETQLYYPGVTYQRKIDTLAAPLVTHILTIDLAEAQPQFFVTPADNSKGRDVRAATVSEFLQQNHRTELAFAINANFFSPFFAHLPGWYYPKSGDSVDVHGQAISNSTIVSAGAENAPAVCFTGKDIQVVAQDCSTQTEHAIAGNLWLLQAGEIVVPNSSIRHPRTAIGITGNTANPEKLVIIAVDGRQNTFSHGVTYQELAELLLLENVTTAINLDGGGSSTLAVYEQGKITLLNNPIHVGLWKNERPVATHLLIRLGNL